MGTPRTHPWNRGGGLEGGAESREENKKLCSSPIGTMLALSGVKGKSWTAGRLAPLKPCFLFHPERMTFLW